MDLFRNKKEELLAWLKSKKYMSTSDILKWGTANYYMRALRETQLLASQGRLRRLTKAEKKYCKIFTKEGVFMWLK